MAEDTDIARDEADPRPDDHHRRVRIAHPRTRMQLNLTSMIDVVFLLLVYFVVTANFAVGEGVITARLPQDTGDQQATQAPPTQPLVIHVSSSGDVLDAAYVVSLQGKRLAGFAELQQTLVQLQADPEAGRHGLFEPDNPVIIQPTGRVRWQHVVNAFNAAVAAKYSNVRFAPPAGG